MLFEDVFGWLPAGGFLMQPLVFPCRWRTRRRIYKSHTMFWPWNRWERNQMNSWILHLELNWGLFERCPHPGNIAWRQCGDTCWDREVDHAWLTCPISKMKSVADPLQKYTPLLKSIWPLVTSQTWSISERKGVQQDDNQVWHRTCHRSLCGRGSNTLGWGRTVPCWLWKRWCWATELEHDRDSFNDL